MCKDCRNSSCGGGCQKIVITKRGERGPQGPPGPTGYEYIFQNYFNAEDLAVRFSNAGTWTSYSSLYPSFPPPCNIAIAKKGIYRLTYVHSPISAEDSASESILYVGFAIRDSINPTNVTPSVGIGTEFLSDSSTGLVDEQCPAVFQYPFILKVYEDNSTAVLVVKVSGANLFNLDGAGIYTLERIADI